MGFLLVGKLLVFVLCCFVDFFEIACIAVPMLREDYNDRISGNAFDQLLEADQSTRVRKHLVYPLDPSR